MTMGIVAKRGLLNYLSIYLVLVLKLFPLSTVLKDTDIPKLYSRVFGSPQRCDLFIFKICS